MNTRSSPVFLKAKTAQMLKQLMLNNNIKTNCWYDYKIIYAEGFWFAWYHKEIEEQLKDDDSKQHS